MADDSEDHIYEIEVTYEDAGFGLNLPLAQWRDRIEEDFGSFEAIKKFHRTDFEDYEETLAKDAKEIGPEEDRGEGPAFIVSNAPKEWKEDFSKAAPYIRFIEQQMVSWALFSLVEDEVEAQRELAKQGLFKPLIVRQSAFFEKYLEFQSQLAFQDQKGSPLSSNEMNIIEKIGHRDRIRLAHLFDVIDEEENGHLQSMASLRNKLAHSPWGELDADTEANIEATAEKVLEILESEIEQSEEAEDYELDPDDDDFDIGFEGLAPDLQLFQLSILEVVDQKGGEDVPLSDIESILPRDPMQVKQRTLRMDHIGYLDLDKEKEIVSIRDQGKELLQEEFDNG